MPTTVTGDPDDGGLTPEQREAIRRIQNNPAFMASIQRAAAASEQARRQVVSSFVAGIAPAMLRALAPTVQAQLDFSRFLEQFREQIAAMQLDMAKQMRVAAFAIAELQGSMARVIVSSEFTEALRRISEIAEASLAMPTDDGIDQVSDLIESGALDEGSLDEAEKSIATNEELSAAIDVAADALARSRPLISRKRARQIVIFWVWLMYGATLWAIAALTNPAIVAVPAAIGLPSAPQAAKKAGEKIVPRRDDEDENDDEDPAEDVAD